jgi:hypothetical protein
MLLPLILGSSPHPPVSVCGTGAYVLDSGFSRQRGLACFGTCISLPVTPQADAARISLRGAPGAWTGASSGRLMLSFCVPTSLKRTSAVREFLRAVHHLRLSASA